MSGAAIVVPCYNEAGRLPVGSFDRYLRDSADVSLLLVDDGSTDDTRAILDGIAELHPDRVQVFSLAHNSGKAEAVRSGMLRAFEFEPSFVGYWDADLATPLEVVDEFRRLLEARPGLDAVLGARVVLLGRRVERNALRHYLGRAAATAIALVLGLPVYDTQCGAKLFRASDEVQKLFRDPFGAHWLFDVEILARLVAGRGAAAQEAIYEQPLAGWTDVPGSKVRASDYVRAALDLVRLHRRYRPRRAAAGQAPRG